jgi:hypothetical protein
MSEVAAMLPAHMVTITHVRFGGGGTSPEDIVMLRWREAIGDTNVADMIEWIESGGVATIAAGDGEHALTVVREPGKDPYLAALAAGERTNKLADLPRF